MKKKVAQNDSRMLLCGKRVRECREEWGYTQSKLIEEIEKLPENNGKTRNDKHLSAVERGERNLSIEYARLISKVLRVSEDYLLGYDDFKTESEKHSEELYGEFERYKWIENIVKSMGYVEEYASKVKYKKIYISSEDTDRIIQEKIDFAKEGLTVMPEYDMIISDQRGRKIHITSSEIRRMYEDMEILIKCRIEREFDDITRYKHISDMGDKKENGNK